MSEVKNKEVKKEASSLAPIKEKDRIMGWGSNTMLWLGGCISIGTLTMGSAQLEKGLNLVQLFAAVLLGSLLLIVGIAMNDQFSYKTGAPYSVQLKSAFGTKGSIVPVMIRGLPGIVWYGFQTWLGGAALNNISIAFFGYDNIWVYFVLFQVVQILLSIKGFQGAKWVGNIGGVVISLAMIYLLYICISQYGDTIGQKLLHKEGTWGMPFIAAVIAFFGNSTTVMLNAGDYSREMKSGYSAVTRGVSYFLAMVPATVLLGLIGAMVSTATGIANPINAFAQMVENKFVLVVTLGFIIFAQLSTNLASNVIPPAYAFMDAFKMKHRTAVILVGVLAVATCPWILTSNSSAAGLDIFVKVYTAFFGPIFAVLITDFFILRRRKYTEEALQDLYDEKGDHAGVNWAAILAIAVGAVIGLLNVNISFFTATIPTGLIYYFGMKKMPSCARFRKGTSLE
ncbi:NCS1 family transporter [Suipraeoptans intestinalis]|uniref:Transporter n=1 Tax=Suipraeoptans intestinalis TaxID=2606628 RepID=A0A6N7V068_9FIRM|nr:NCS1 family transporter [Suipraeoptans intestinalis]MDD7769887.1 NCS1 family transporter [Suipraeoptans intestinalis]MSR93530.1 transporter [Suipraeoptans intestinalis]